MKSYLFERLNKPVVRGSIILLITFGIFNALNYIFNFTMLHLLTVAEYGIVATLFSIIYIFGIFTESIQTVIAKYTSSEKNLGKLKNIIKKSINKAILASTLFFLGYLVLSIILSPLLKINYSLFLITGLMIFTSFILPVTRGVMQGRKNFVGLGSSMIIESVVKLSFACILVIWGWSVYGAMTASVLGVFLALIFSFFDKGIMSIFKSREKIAKTPGIRGYSLPVFILTFTVLAFYSLDIFIAKIVFDAETAGYYALAAILAKTIFFGTYPIGKAMFPLSVEESGNKKKNPSTFRHALILLLLCIFVALFVMYFFPDVLISISSGKSAPLSRSILFTMGVGMSFLSLANMTILYKLSRGKVRGYEFAVLFLLIEIGLLFFFSGNLQEFSLAFLTSSICFLWWATTFLDNDWTS